MLEEGGRLEYPVEMSSDPRPAVPIKITILCTSLHTVALLNNISHIMLFS